MKNKWQVLTCNSKISNGDLLLITQDHEVFFAGVVQERSIYTYNSDYVGMDIYFTGAERILDQDAYLSVDNESLYEYKVLDKY